MSNPHVHTHYIECQLNRNRPTFTYSLRKGWSDLRIGQIIFEQEGLNDLLAASGHSTVSSSDNHRSVPPLII